MKAYSIKQPDEQALLVPEVTAGSARTRLVSGQALSMSVSIGEEPASFGQFRRRAGHAGLARLIFALFSSPT